MASYQDQGTVFDSGDIEYERQGREQMTAILSQANVETKAEEILQLFMIWGISRADAYKICRDMKHKCQNMPDSQWRDPLAGTGLSADSVIDMGLKQEN